VTAHHRIALLTIAAALFFAAVLGLAFAKAEHVSPAHGMFCGLANAVTDGCDIAPRTTAAYIVTVAEYFLCVPLFGATFSLFISGLTASHVAGAEQRIKHHTEERLRHHLAQAGAVTAVLPSPMAAGSAGTSGARPTRKEGRP
jgi:hypothetical protein